MRIRHACLTLTLALGSLAGPAAAATVWDESVNGDLSTNNATPTAVAFAPGSNVVHGRVTNSAPADNRDYLTFTVPANHGLYKLLLLRWDAPDGSDGNTGFNAINSGATSFVPSAGTIASFLGANHVEAFSEGSDMLANMAGGLGSSGFTVPLGPGTYSYVIQQTGADINLYSLDFIMRQVPEPTSLAMGILGMAGLICRRRR